MIVKHVVSCLLLLAIALTATCGCTNEHRSAEEIDDPKNAVRIVSFSPAISRTLIDLGLDQYLVGRTPFCETSDPTISVVGDLHDVNMEMLVRVRPTHLLVQPPAEGINPALTRLARERSWTIGAWHLDTVSDVRLLLTELPSVLASEHDPALADTGERAAAILRNIRETLQPRDNIFTGPVLLVFSTEPATVFGRGTYLDEVLTTLGGINAVRHRGYPQFSLEDISRMKPEGMILIAPGAPDEDLPKQRLRALARLDVPAVHHDRLAVLNHPDAFLPSSGLAGVAEALREILHTMHRPDDQP